MISFSNDEIQAVADKLKLTFDNQTNTLVGIPDELADGYPIPMVMTWEGKLVMDQVGVMNAHGDLNLTECVAMALLNARLQMSVMSPRP